MILRLFECRFKVGLIRGGFGRDSGGFLNIFLDQLWWILANIWVIFSVAVRSYSVVCFFFYIVDRI